MSQGFRSLLRRYADGDALATALADIDREHPSPDPASFGPFRPAHRSAIIPYDRYVAHDPRVVGAAILLDGLLNVSQSEWARILGLAGAIHYASGASDKSSGRDMAPIAALEQVLAEVTKQ